jgi:hypothetical protein
VTPTTLNQHTYPAVHLLGVYLLNAHFEDGGPGAAVEGLDYLVDLTVGRDTPLELSVALTVATSERAPVRLRVTYGADFLLPEDATDEDREEVMRETAYRLAPAMLYSYIRQFFSDVTGRGRGERIALPFLPIPLDLDRQEQAVPPAPPA